MELPGWVRDPYIFLRYLLPGFLFLSFAAAFFPRLLDSATRAVSVTQGRSDLILFLWVGWTVAIGLVLHALYRPVYDRLLRPRPRHEEVVSINLKHILASVPKLEGPELRTLYALVAGHFQDSSAQSWARREANLIHATYQVLAVLAFTGLFLILFPPSGPLVSQNWPSVQGGVFVGAALILGCFVWRRDDFVQRTEIAAIPWESKEVRDLLEAGRNRLLRARGERVEMPPADASGAPPSKSS